MLGLILLNILLVGIILGHRYLRRRTNSFQLERGLRWGFTIEQIVAEGQIPSRVPAWQGEWDIAAATDAVLSEWARASLEQRDLLKSLFRVWGLFDEHRQRLRRRNRWDRARSALVLGRLQFSEVQEELSSQLHDAPDATQAAIINALGLLGLPDACDPLIDFLTKSGVRYRCSVLSALISCSQSHPSRLVPYLHHPDALVREVAAEALASLAGYRELPSLLAVSDDPSPEVRAKVARCLRRTPGLQSLTVLRKMARDPVWFVRLQAANALAVYDLPGVEDTLVEMTCDTDWRVRGNAALALYRHIPDAIALLQMMQSRVQDRYALEAVVAALERDGVIWWAVDELANPDSSKRARSTALVVELLRVRTFACILYALEMHPRDEIRHAVLAILQEHGQSAMAPQLKPLLDSPHLDAASRGTIVSLLQEWEH